jgi:acetyl esterase/lipase
LKSALVFLAALLLASPAFAEPPATQPSKFITQPERPATGPGSADYPHRAFRRTQRGQGDTACILFEPAEPRPAAAPVVVFLHGWLAVEPAIYGGWIKHLVLRGNIVIFPRYQDKNTAPAAYSTNVMAGVRDAVAYLQKADGAVRPDLARVAVVGHSCGGILAANYAACAADNALPVPSAVMCVEPGKSGFFALADLSRIPADALLLTVAGDLDRFVGDGDAKKIFAGATGVKKENRNMIIMRSDTHGSPGFFAGHLAPLCFDELTSGAAPAAPPGRRAVTTLDGRSRPVLEMSVDAVDYVALWRWCDALMHAAFTGEGKEQVLGDTPAQRDMGKWSDGVPVKEPTVILAE